MSKETNLRYEQPHRPSKLFQEYTKKLQANDNLLINDIDQKLVDQQELHDKWFEESNKKHKTKQILIQQEEAKKTLKIVAKASLMVRRRALTLRMESDRKMYEEELAQMGKTFHQQRI